MAHIEAEVAIPPVASFCLRLYGHEIAYADGRIQCLGKAAPLLPVAGVVNLRILVDLQPRHALGDRPGAQGA